MFRNKRIEAARFAALMLLATALGAAFAGCKDEPTWPLQDEERQILKPGLNVYLTLDSDDAALGATVRVVAKVRAVDVKLTPTGFQVDLRYDPEKLEPLDAAEIRDGVLRAVNLSAGPGLVRAAGAAADGIDTGVLFALDMKVKATAYAESLALGVRELTVLEQNFADLKADVALAPRAVVVAR
jgi:hypothetical protein